MGMEWLTCFNVPHWWRNFGPNRWRKIGVCIDINFLLSFWHNYEISVGLSRLHCLHHGSASHYPRKSPQFHSTVCSIYMFWYYNTIVPFCQQEVLEPKLECLKDKDIFPFFTTHQISNIQCFHLHNSNVWHNRYTNVTSEQWTRYASGTPTGNSPGHK